MSSVQMVAKTFRDRKRVANQMIMRKLFGALEIQDQKLHYVVVMLYVRSGTIQSCTVMDARAILPDWEGTARPQS